MCAFNIKEHEGTIFECLDMETGCRTIEKKVNSTHTGKYLESTLYLLALVPFHCDIKSSRGTLLIVGVSILDLTLNGKLQSTGSKSKEEMNQCGEQR